MTDRTKLRELADKAVDDFFETEIDNLVDGMVTKIVEKEHIDNEDDINYLKVRIERGILKWS